MTGLGGRRQAARSSCREGPTPLDDLTQRDLSSIPDAELSPDERRELQRRFEDFVGLLRARAGRAVQAPAKPKRIMRWDPVALSRRH